MPRIFDNIGLVLHPALSASLAASTRADFCVGYFNLRGWKLIDQHIDSWVGTDENKCRVLVGMQKLPQDELREALSLRGDDGGIDLQQASELRVRIAQEFREQLAFGVPTNGSTAVSVGEFGVSPFRSVRVVVGRGRFG